MTTNAPTFAMYSKIRLLKDHNGKLVKGHKYGYIVSIVNCVDAPDGFICTEKGFQNEGMVYLIKTSWSGGMLWYSKDAICLAGGKHELQNWEEKLIKWNKG